MNGVYEFAKMLKSLENKESYNPVFGTVTDLDELTIMRGDRVRLGKNNIKSLINLYEKDINGNYVNLQKSVLLLPYADSRGRMDNKYVVLGVVQDG